MILAVDFDGTLFDHAYPNIGNPFYNRIAKLKELKETGHKLILWTCRGMEGERNCLEEAIKACSVYGLEFDAINSNLQETLENFPERNDSRKIYADYYIDDRSLDLKNFFNEK